jgi:hypothetical protein
MDPTPDRTPVRPLYEGSETIDEGGVRFTYTIGRDHIKDPLREILMSRRPVAVDIETEGLGASALNLKSVSFSTTDQAVVCDPRDEFQRDLIYKSLAYARELMFWNSPFDVPNLARNGLFEISWCAKVTDGVIYARLAEPDERKRKSLDAAWERYFGSGDDGTGAERKAKAENKAMFRIIGARNTVEGFLRADLHMPAYVLSAAADVIHTARLVPRARQAAYDQLTRGHPYSDEGVSGDEAWALVEREQRMNRMLLRRAVKGLRVDFEYLDQYREDNAAEIDEATRLLEANEVKPTNARTLFDALLREGAVPESHPKTATGLYSATATHLETLSHPLAQAFVARKKLVKNDEDYLAKVVELASSAGRIHPVANLFGASATGRMSYGTPPLQQFPKPARGIVLADEGSELVSIDWSQIEPVIAANLAGEEDVLKRYEDPTVKADLYAPVAEKAGIARKQAKTVLLGLLYGLGAGKLSVQLGCSEDEAYDLRDSVFDAMPYVAEWTRGLRDDAEKNMKVITLAGRILPIPMGTYEGRTSVQTHKGINYCVGMSTPVLQAGLQHVPAAKIQVGDRLVGFDEHPKPADLGGQNRYHHLRTAVVEAVSTVVKPSLRIRTADGKVTDCSTDHLWLVRPIKGRKNNRPRVWWVRADELRPGDDLLSLGTWEVADSRTAGYIAGLYDGEGSLTRHAGGRRKNQLFFSQNSGEVMNAFCAGMSELGLVHSYYARCATSTSTTDSVAVNGLRNVLRALGTLQPERFRPRFEEVYEGNAITAGLTESVPITAIEPAGGLELASIQTTTRTFIANGYLSHNCVQGSAYDLLADSAVAIEEAGLGDAIYLLMHDENVVDKAAAHDIRKIMETPPERLCRFAQRTPVLRTDMEEMGVRWVKPE